MIDDMLHQNWSTLHRSAIDLTMRHSAKAARRGVLGLRDALLNSFKHILNKTIVPHGMKRGIWERTITRRQPLELRSSAFGQVGVDDRLSATAKQIRLEIKDGGKGIPQKRMRSLIKALPSGVGLAGMRERIHEGRLSFSLQNIETNTGGRLLGYAQAPHHDGFAGCAAS
jgi:hypothetical protein